MALNEIKCLFARFHTQCLALLFMIRVSFDSPCGGSQGTFRVHGPDAWWISFYPHLSGSLKRWPTNTPTVYMGLGPTLSFKSGSRGPHVQVRDEPVRFHVWVNLGPDPTRLESNPFRSLTLSTKERTHKHGCTPVGQLVTQMMLVWLLQSKKKGRM